MKKMFSGLRSKRRLIQLKHGEFRDLGRKYGSSIYRRMSKGHLEFPSMVLVEVTNECMLDCIMCPHSQLKEKTGLMQFDLFKKIIDECRRHHTLGDLVFSGMGEPLLHPQIIEMGRYAKSRGIPNVRLITNAVCLSKDKTEELLGDSGFDEIHFSLDALTEETYRKIKGRDVFETVQENIKYFLSQKREKKRWKPFVNLHILRMRDTVDEIDGFFEKWSPLLSEGDQILVKEVHTQGGTVGDRRLEDQIPKGERFPCRQLWEFLYVCRNGDVVPCCMDPFKKLKIGNLNESSLKELWDGPNLKRIRDIHQKGRYDEIPQCSQCESFWNLGSKPK